MAVPHFSVSLVGRGTGRSAVLSAAYRHCAKMYFEREARTVDYRAKQGLLFEAFSVPADVPEWLSSILKNRSVAEISEAFWNRVEDFETRSDAQLSRDLTIALPRELSADQNIALVEEFIHEHVTARGMVADWVYHDPPGNPHIHLMTTLRPLTLEGFGNKKIAVIGKDGMPVRNDAGKIVYELWTGGLEDFNALRDGWFACQNRHLALAGLELSVDGRSYERQGLDLAPTIHLGVATKALQRKADAGRRVMGLERFQLQGERRTENVKKLLSRPERVLDVISREKSVFDERDIAKVLHRYVDDAVLFQSLMARILQAPEILRLDRERLDFVTGIRVPAKYTTRTLIRLEAEMVSRAIRLSRGSTHRVRQARLNAGLARHDSLSQEQRAAIGHVTRSGQIAAIVGRAGAGKTTMMKAAREIWTAEGYHVVGGALAGKAAEGLTKEAGISSRTLSSWELSWGSGRDLLDHSTIFVLDEAGMVSSRQMALVVDAVSRARAKLVLIGDPDQLQPIEAGAAFRTIADRIGYRELTTIYRQRQAWMREASLDLAQGEIARAIDAYGAMGRLVTGERKADAIEALICDWDRDHELAGSMLILAHLRRDVRLLNSLARERLIERGLLVDGAVFETAEGQREFAAGDQIVFLKNEASLGVKNGTTGRVVKAKPGQILVAVGDQGSARHVLIEQRFYNMLDYGYATTIHKAQGATVDRVKVLASLSLDRHLTYVAMTRHRDDLSIYYGRQSFAKAGGLIPVLSRKNAKETTLDYLGSDLYREALRFAQSRGLSIMAVARTLMRDRLAWTLRQKQRLTDLASRLQGIGARLGLLPPSKVISGDVRQLEPMISGVATFPTSVRQAVEERLTADPHLTRLWAEVSQRLHLVYDQAERAFKAIDVDGMIKDPRSAARRIAKIRGEPETFGALKGAKGLLASRHARTMRGIAEQNVMPLVDSLRAYLDHRAKADARLAAEERTIRKRFAIAIPALSPEAQALLVAAHTAIDRGDGREVLEVLKANPDLKVELDVFAGAVAERFGARRFLPAQAGDPESPLVRQLVRGMSERTTNEIVQALPHLQNIQRLVAAERSALGLSASEALLRTNHLKAGLK